MSVLIKNMEMPQNCGECKFFAWKRGVGTHCAIDDSITFHPTLYGLDVRYEKNGNCPLVPVPPHGRLIDADASIDVAEGHVSQGQTTISAFLLNHIEGMVPLVVIPAEEANE